MIDWVGVIVEREKEELAMTPRCLFKKLVQ